MPTSYFQFQFQRRLRRLRRSFYLWRAWGRNYLDRHIWGKWRQLGIIRRFVLVWWGALILMFAGLASQIQGLEAYYLAPGPVAGGNYVEAEVGKVKLINPILADSAAASDVDRLVFSGLTRYTPDRGLEGDLAESWEVSPDQRTYTFHLRHNVKWHDDVPFTARDVAFTVIAIQNPDTRSPLFSSWQGVRAEAKDDYTVVFTLPNPYSPFLYSTNVGILPSHILESTDPQALQTSSFNQQPIGTGPFRLKALIPSQGEVQLDPNRDYYMGAPKLKGFTFRLFNSYGDVLDAFAKRQVTAIARFQTDDPAAGKVTQAAELKHLSLPDETAVFFKTTNPVLTPAVRQALARLVDRQQVISQGLGGDATPLYGPLLPGQLGYSSDREPAFDPTAAANQLDQAGWVKDAKGQRQKDGQPLRLKLVTADTADYRRVAEIIKQQWAAAGVQTDLTFADSKTLQQSYIKPRNYDALLFGISVGADPDVYAYWHSSQAEDPGLNLAAYNSAPVDRALENARLTADAAVRMGKYKTFQQTFVADVPAVVLYQPDYVYAVAPGVFGIKAHKLVDPQDRFYNVWNWTVRTKPTLRAKVPPS